MTATNVVSVNEVWKDIPGYEGFYMVSNVGRVKTLNRQVLNERYGQQILITRPEKILSLSISKKQKGYSVVTLHINKKGKQFFVHRLVAEAFIGPRPEGLFVNHIDGDKLNNTPTNLEYVTVSENLLHAFKAGLNTSRKRTKRCSLTDEQVREVRSLHKQGLGPTEIGRRIGYKPSRVSDIIKGLRYSWVE